MRFIAGNWKMNHGPEEAREWARAVKHFLRPEPDRLALLFPPYTLLSQLANELQDTPVALGGQNIYPATAGAYTGEISPRQLRQSGATYVLVGHSERRQLLGENLDFIHRKVVSALEEGLTPVLCVGESGAERAAGRTGEILTTQVVSALTGIAPMAPLIIAYEPVWAIGTGLTPSNDDIAAAHAHIRGQLAKRFGKEAETMANTARAM